MAEFPVLHGSWREQQEASRLGCPRSVPWELIAPHERQARKNHDQSLKRLAERGGLCPSEIVAVLRDRDWHNMELADAIADLQVLIAAFSAITRTESDDV